MHRKGMVSAALNIEADSIQYLRESLQSSSVTPDEGLLQFVCLNYVFLLDFVEVLQIS